eukprot:3705149-Prymnesium_polylepis.2
MAAALPLELLLELGRNKDKKRQCHEIQGNEAQVVYQIIDARAIILRGIVSLELARVEHALQVRVNGWDRAEAHQAFVRSKLDALLDPQPVGNRR